MNKKFASIWAASVLCAALSLASIAAAQDAPGVVDYRESNSVTIAPGVERGSYNFSTQEYTTVVNYTTVQLLNPGVIVEPLLPARGPNTFMPLQSLAESGGAPVAVMSLDLTPPFGQSAGLQGLRMANGKLYSWPPHGAHLILQSDGTASFAELPENFATIRFSDGTLLPLGSLNGPVVPGARKASLYTGSLSSGDSILAELRGSTAIVILKPEDGNDPHAMFLEAGDKNRRLIPERITDGNLLAIDTNEAALVLPAPVDPALLERLRAKAPLEITINLDPAVQFARAAVPVGARFLHDSTITEDAPATVRNGIALDAEGRRMRAFTTATTRGSGAADTKKLSEFLVKEGFTEAVALDDRLPMLTPDWKARDQFRDAGMAPTRLALVIRQGTAVVAAPDLDKKISRIAGVVMDGTRREFPVNQPSSLGDGRQSPGGGLDQFWASPIKKDQPAVITMLLPKPQPVAAVELIHAEAVGFSPQFDLREFKISGRLKANGAWTPLASINHPQPVGRERVVLPGSPSVQELRLEIVTPSFLPGGDVARIAEIILWAPAP
ncbi:hypothetical protein BH09SUM1_BH09SUM1_06040 [soil metagenome]